MAPGVLCPECISSEENRQNSDAALASHQEITKPYGWGKFQGVALIVGSVTGLIHEPSTPVDNADFFLSVFSIVLGICILRKNRLILPLLGLAMILLTSGVIAGSLMPPGDFTYSISIAFVVWALSCFYYYRRRSEFRRWL